MNFLTQIVPGLRDTRVPLAVGAVYAMAFWVAFPTIDVLPLNKFITDLVSQWQDLPEVVALGAGLFAVYLAGIILELVGRAAISLIRYAVIVAFVLIVVLLIAGFTLGPILRYGLLPHLILIVLVYHILAWRYSRLSISAYAKAVRSGTELLLYRLTQVKSLRFLDADRKLVPMQAVAEELDKAIKQPEVADKLVSATSDEFIARCLAERADIHPDKLKGLRFGVGRFHRLLQLMQSDGAISASFRSVFVENLAIHRGARNEFADACLDTDAFRDEVQKKLDRTEKSLQVAGHDRFSDFDRSRAESELRTGLSLPVALLCAATVYRWGEYGDITSPNTLLLALGVFAGTFLTLYGLGCDKMQDARSLIYSCYESSLLPDADDRQLSSVLAVQPLANSGGKPLRQRGTLPDLVQNARVKLLSLVVAAIKDSARAVKQLWRKRFARRAGNRE